MDVLDGISSGFLIALTLKNVLYCFMGALIGTLIGVLPGIGPLATIAMLMPFTYHVDPVSSMIMLAGIFYGAQYGGSTTSILLNLPGEASSVITCLDGHQLAKKGKAGVALSIAAVGSLVAGTIGTLTIVLLAPVLVNFAEKFGPAEYCGLMTLGLVVAVVLANGSILKAIAMVFLGVLFGLAGTELRDECAALHIRYLRNVRWHRLRADCDGAVRHSRDHLEILSNARMRMV